MTRTAAGLECQSLDGRAHLLVINDAQEQAAFESFALGQFTFLVFTRDSRMLRAS